MQPIKISNKSPDLNLQLEFLIKREFYVAYNRYKKPAYYFLGWIIILLLFSYLSGDNFVVLKGVLLFVTAVAFLAAVVFITTILIKLLKRNVWKGILSHRPQKAKNSIGYLLMKTRYPFQLKRILIT